jgi:cysteinyl-tRNA synthetase
MSEKFLGPEFDIHGGGQDLIFPHHENEIAQSEARHGRPMAKYWMHNGLMQASSEVGKIGGRETRPADGDVDAQEAGKISKSKGSSAFSEMLKDFPAETIRFFLLSTHYRRPIDFSEERIRQVGTGLDAFYRFFKRCERITGRSVYQLEPPSSRADGELTPGDDPLLTAVAEQRNRFLEVMDDDFNTGGATGVLFDLVRKLNKFVDDEKLEEAKSPDARLIDSLERGVTTLRELAAILGLFAALPTETSTGGNQLVGQLMDLFIQVRADARKQKDFATADGIRDGLAELGVTLEDRPGGTEWSIG